MEHHSDIRRVFRVTRLFGGLSRYEVISHCINGQRSDATPGEFGRRRSLSIDPQWFKSSMDGAP
jgi:hypothetical protein